VRSPPVGWSRKTHGGRRPWPRPKLVSRPSAGTPIEPGDGYRLLGQRELTTAVVAASMPGVNPTPKQHAYLDFIRKYAELHGTAPAEHEMQAFFGTTPPAVHRMVVALTENGLITRQPRVARSIRLVEDAVVEDGGWDDYVPSRPPDEITEPLDRPIAPVVDALRADARILTKGSCWGHGKKPAYIDLAVEGMAGLRAFVERLNLVDCRVRDEALFDVALNWSEEVVMSCAFDLFPDWIMLSWRIEGGGRGRAPSAEMLGRIAGAYRRASRSPTTR